MVLVSIAVTEEYQIKIENDFCSFIEGNFSEIIKFATC